MGLVAQRAPNFEQALGKRIFSDRRVGPDGINQLGLGQEPTMPLDEIREDIERLRTQPDFRGAAVQNAAIDIQREIGKPVLAAGRRFGGVGARAAQGASLQSGGSRAVADRILRPLAHFHKTFNAL